MVLNPKDGQAEIKDLAEKYPKYAREIMDIVGQYEKDFS